MLDAADHRGQRALAGLDVEVGHPIDRRSVPVARARGGDAGDAGARLGRRPAERSLEDARNEVSDKQVALDKADADLKSFEIERRTKRAQSQMELTLAEREGRSL